MKAQSVSTRIITVSLAIIVMLVLGAFFLVNMGGAQETVGSSSISGGQCQADCRDLIGLAFNYDSCESVLNNQKAIDYIDDCAVEFGPCKVTIKNSVNCIIQ